VGEEEKLEKEDEEAREQEFQETILALMNSEIEQNQKE
jgi:hypothetical protein